MKLLSLLLLAISSLTAIAQEKKVVENRLAKEASPYLRQHSKNPVNWYPWGKEAFEKAKKENKPILLSIGYSTCHWCHVMERESFEDKKIAAYLNKHFVAIKLDREERPDIDKIYMTTYNVMSGESGGWPLNVFLTPDLEMFYGGTYFPARDKARSIGFESVLHQLQKAWSEDSKNVVKSAKGLTAHMKKAMAERKPAENIVDPIVLKKASDLMIQNADMVNGGWGAGNKFPMPSHLAYLLRAYKKTGDKKLLEFVELTANKMAAGGIHDHLGGGFHRYTVDKIWLVPHFEKMLYDQAQLLDLYLDLMLITKDPHYMKVAKDIADYVIREMQDENGGYYCAQDAQSEGKEGKYFCWTMAELKTLLDENQLKVIIKYFGVTEKGNFYDHSDPKALSNQNVLSIQNTAILKGEKHLLKTAIESMRIARGKRIKPMTDKKMLSSWNGMMIGAMSRAGLVLKNEKYSKSAEKAYDFIQKTMWNAETKTLSHRYFNHDGRIDIDNSQQAESYLHMMQAARRRYEITLDPEALAWAIDLAGAAEKLFYDKEKGGFYESAAVDDVVIRLKGDFDGATPTTSSVALMEYLKLHAITSDPQWKKIALDTMKSYGNDLSKYPTSLTYMLSGLDYYHSRKQRLVIVADAQEGVIKSRNSLSNLWLPNITYMSNQGKVDPFNLTLKPLGNKSTYYYCEGKTCKPPINSAKELIDLLGKWEKKGETE